LFEQNKDPAMHSLFRIVALSLLACSCAVASTSPVSPGTAPGKTEFNLQTATIEDINKAFDAGALTSEKLVQLYLNRIAAYDKKGPNINAIITLQPKALEIARALDAERKAKGPRSKLHGIPLVFKDLYDTKDMPTSAGFLPMKNSQPVYDATIVARLREAGAIVFAKVNMSDWFGVPKRGDQSTVLGRTSNPYNTELSPSGSSGGTGASVAAAFAQAGMGSETGTSIRGPTAANSVVGLAPTRGLIPRAGQVMTSFTQERAGPMARSVYDVAALTDIVAGFDAEDLLTVVSPGRTPNVSYTTVLRKDGLRGARIGVLRDFFRKGERHAEGIAIIENAIAQIKEQGAVVVDGLSLGVDAFPLLDGTGPDAFARTNYYEGQFSYNLYFRRLGPNVPIHNMDELIAKGGKLLKPSIAKAYGEFRSIQTNADFIARRDTQETMAALMQDLMKKYRLDAVVYPFRSVPPPKHMEDQVEADNSFSSVSGMPAVVMPAGYTKETNGPIAIEFLGMPFSEPTLFKLAYAFEQGAKLRKLPPTTPPLPGEIFSY
jgi:Asp-tRNA(Asn)/Glu-tRNA(Gln) amidotransferase A subunit family amidase